MSIFDQAIVKFKQRPGFFIPFPFRQALAAYNPTSTDAIKIYPIIEAFIHYKQSKRYRYYTSSTLINFERDVKQAIHDTYKFRHDDLIYLSLTERHPDDHIICGWLVLLHADLYSMPNQEQIRSFCKTYEMAKGLYVLVQAQLLNQATLDFMLRHKKPLDALSAIFILKDTQQLNHSNVSQLMRQKTPGLGQLLHTMWHLNSALIADNLSYLFTLSIRSIQSLQKALNEFLQYTVATPLDQILLNSFFIAIDDLGEDLDYQSKEAIFETLCHYQLLPCSKEVMSAVLLDKNNHNAQSIIDIMHLLYQSHLPFSIGSVINTIIIHRSAGAMKLTVAILKQQQLLNESLLITCAKYATLRKLIHLISQTAPHCLNTKITRVIQKPHVAQELLIIWHPDLTIKHILTFCNHRHRWRISLSIERLNIELIPKQLFILDAFLTCHHASCIQPLEGLVRLLSPTPLLTATHLHHAVHHLNHLPPLMHKTQQDIIKSTLLYIQHAMNDPDQTELFRPLLDALSDKTKPQVIDQYLHWQANITSLSQEMTRQSECTL
jgi:hypothetical protein